MKVCLVALGCEKNVINSEQMLWLMDSEGMQLVPSPDGADVTVVNTCGFIESAKREAIENILEIAQFSCKIVVAGCMAERHREEIFAELPEVAGLVGCGRFDDIVQAVRQAADGERPALFGGLDSPVSETERILTSPDHTAFIKIADGCDNRCAYCVIPSLRGAYRSRPMENILAEAESLVQNGARELILIAQDTTRYGTDLPGGERLLPELLTSLCAIDGLDWLRIHYLYPDMITEELIDVIAREEKICKYLDIPMQHASDNILRAMNRRYDGAYLRALIARLREKIPGLVLRTSLIVGFPGENEDDFGLLCDFLRDMRLERAGVFTYSAEEGTAAALMPEQVDEDVKRMRAERVEMLQSEIMDAFNAAREGGSLRVLCEGYDRFAEVYFGRSGADSPEVDGKVFFKSKRKIPAGEMVEVSVTESIDGDLLGEII